MKSLNTLLNASFILIVLCACGKTLSVEDQKVQNLRAFTKLYGYVKYFHPSDEASQIDWNKFAVYGTQQVIELQNGEELKSILEKLFLPIAPAIQIYYSDEKPNPFIVPEDTTDLQVIAWQHLGEGSGSTGSIYRSIRTNRENLISSKSQGIGTVTQGIDAKDFRGKEIKLVASVRTNVTGSGDQGQLWLRVDRENGKRGFFDNMDDRPIKYGEWLEYEIKGRVADDATKIFFGCFLKGTGTVWVDGFQLHYKNSDDAWKTIKIENSGFEKGVNEKPIMWSTASPGYTYQLVGNNPYEGEKSLLIENEWKSISETLYETFPQVGEVINKELGAGLSCQVPLALYSDSNGTFGQTDQASFDTIYKELNKISIGELTADNEFVRLGNIAIAWNVFQHFYPYFDVVGTNWDSELTNTFNEVLNNKDEKEFYSSLQRLVAKLHDGHGNVYNRRLSNKAGFSFLVDWIENKVVITLSKDSYKFNVGDIVVSVDGVAAEKILLDQEQFQSGSPQWNRFKSLRRFSYGDKGTTSNLKIMRNGQDLTIEAVRNNKEYLSMPGSSIIEEIEDDIFYVNLDKVEMNKIEEQMDVLSKAKGVIFDLRGYPNSNHDVISFLLTDPDVSGAWMMVPQIIYPDQENVVGFASSGWYLQPKKPHIEGKVVFLTDGRAISYAESFMSFIEHYELAEIVGQPTAGTNGNVNFFDLPGGFRVVWTGMKVVKHDGSQHHLIGIQPTIFVERSIKGVIEGRDELLEKALDVIRTE